MKTVNIQYLDLEGGGGGETERGEGVGEGGRKEGRKVGREE